MTGTEPRASARKRWAFTAIVVAELLLIAYLIAGAFRADDEWRLWYALGAAGLFLLVGAIVWSRWRGPASRG
ncbi:hypothetical protein GCM10020218_001490 [Dactylosporangium vinaceum]